MVAEGRVLLVTGASRGIGRSVAVESARVGMDVILVARRDQAALDSAIEAVEQAGGRGAGLIADLAYPEEVERVLAFVTEHVGRLDVLVNNAGRAVKRTVEELTIDDWNLTMSVNLLAPFLLVQAFLPLLRQGRFPAVINISSIVGRTGGKVGADYAASKGGLVALTRYLAGQLGSEGIRVNCVAPSPTNTDMWQELVKTSADVGGSDYVGEPEEVADLVVHLATTKSGFLQGECIYLTGGTQVR